MKDQTDIKPGGAENEGKIRGELQGSSGKAALAAREDMRKAVGDPVLTQGWADHADMQGWSAAMAI